MDLFGIEFKSTFGFRPSRVNGMQSHEQEFVDATLTTLAADFWTWSENQTSILAIRPSKGKTLEETKKGLRDHENSLKAADRFLRNAKENFWRAHGLAKSREYHVRERYTDYIPQK